MADHRRSGPGRACAVRPRPGRPRRGARAQATVEFALGLPVLFLAVTLLLQFAFIGRDVLLVHHAAREGARAAATDPGAATAGAIDASAALDPRRLEVSTRDRGDRVAVTVRYRAITGFPIVGPMLPDIDLTASATAAREE